MADILQELIAAVSEGISGPGQPGDPQVIMDPAGAQADTEILIEAG